MHLPEPWLRGPREGVHPVAAHLSYTFQQCREELAHWTAGLEERLWEAPRGLAPLGFQIAHIAGSVGRLTTYLEDTQLAEEQLAELRQELTLGWALPELVRKMEAAFARAEAVAMSIPPERYEEFRGVGRKGLPTTAGGLIVHMAEHSQRHLGQAVLTAKVLRADK